MLTHNVFVNKSTIDNYNAIMSFFIDLFFDLGQNEHFSSISKDVI